MPAPILWHPTPNMTKFAGTEAPSVLYERPHWYACYTHGRHEKRVASRLEEAGIESYVPLRVERRRWTDRVRDVELPMFPSYVFGRFRLGSLRQVLDVPGIVTAVRVGPSAHPTPIPDSDIEYARQATEQARRHCVVPEVVSFLGNGNRVRVVSGAFRGIEGVVVHLRGRTHVLVGLSAIGQGLAIQLHPGCLKPLV